MEIFGFVMSFFTMGVCGLAYLAKHYISWVLEYYSFHTSIQHVIKELQCFCQSQSEEKFTTLDLHIISKDPIFDKEPNWELFLNDLDNPEIENIKEVNLVFIVESNDLFKPLFKSDHTHLDDGRIVTHTMKQTFYHMYYSSPEYDEPDALLLYNTSTMLENEQDAIHSEMSYRNMTAQKVVLALFDKTQDRLRQGIKALESARPGLHVSDYKITEMKGFYFTFIKIIGS